MKKIKFLFAISWTLITLGAFAMFGFGSDDDENNEIDDTVKECEIPAFAKAIGHEDLWLKHNGCPPRKKTEKTDEE